MPAFSCFVLFATHSIATISRNHQKTLVLAAKVAPVSRSARARNCCGSWLKHMHVCMQALHQLAGLPNIGQINKNSRPIDGNHRRFSIDDCLCEIYLYLRLHVNDAKLPTRWKEYLQRATHSCHSTDRNNPHAKLPG
jgi:hypothetical protein